MIQKNLKSVLCSLCVLLCSAMFCLPTAYATTTASIEVEYVYDDQPIEGAEVEIYLVAQWLDGSYQLTSDFSDLDVDFSDLTSPSDWRDEGEAVDAYIQDVDCGCEDDQCTDETGGILFSDLAYGVYYVDVEDVAYGDGALVSSPVLLTLPAYDSTNNIYTYDVVMEPKVVFVVTPDEPTTPTTPTWPTIPSTPSIPELPYNPETPEYHIEIIEPGVPLIEGHWLPIPQTGTYEYLSLPLALIGAALLLFGVFGLGEKRERHEE